MILPFLFLAPSDGMGRGVFTDEPIKAGMVVEIAPVIVMSAMERKQLDQTSLYHYIFEWGDNKDQCVMALGYVPMYNHSYKSNCEYEMDYVHDLIHIRAVKDIGKGEELFINYNGEWNDATPLWFDAK